MFHKFLFSSNNGGGPWGRGGGNNGDDGKPQNPWGRRSSENKGTDGIEDAIEMMQRRFKKNFSSGDGGNFGNQSFKPKTLILGAFLVAGLWASTGFFRVQEGELAVVLRFGEMVRIVSPGLQYHFPMPFERAIVQKVSAVNTIDSGVKTSNNDTAPDQTLILTGDENMVHTNYTILWKINDIKDFLFTNRKPEATIRVAAESVVREIIGQTQSRIALTEGRDRIGQQAQEFLQRLLDAYKLGVQVISVQLQSVAPPREVVESFNDVQASLVDAEREINVSESYRNDIIPRARGLAIQTIQDAEAYRASQIAHAEGEASRFNQVVAAYWKNPKITMRRYYLETMQSVLSASNTVILDPKISQGILPYLPLNDLKAQKPPAVPAPQAKTEGN